MVERLLLLTKQVQSIAEAGIYFAQNDYDLERFNTLQKISIEMLECLLNQPLQSLGPVVIEKSGYKTPKVDVRALILNEKQEVLLVKECYDGKWSMPGGWADIGLTVRENVIKEVKEEAGVLVEAQRVVAIFDKKCHPHPQDHYYVYKIVMYCKVISGSFHPGMETQEVKFFPLDQLPELSTPRILKEEIEIALNHFISKSVYCD